MNGPGGHADPAYHLDSSGPAAPPRDNGELVFAAPWESRAFGLALALNEAGLIDWEDFRQALIREIGDWEAAHPSGAGWSYYECWLRALERTASAGAWSTPPHWPSGPRCSRRAPPVTTMNVSPPPHAITRTTRPSVTADGTQPAPLSWRRPTPAPRCDLDQQIP